MKKRVIRILFLIFVIFVLQRFFIQPFRTFGISMEPTIHDNSIVFVNKIVYKFRKPQRGEIIVFRTNEKPYLYFMKRVIGLPGEIVEIKNGVLYVNGKRKSEPYLKFKNNWNIGPFKVKENCVFVIGDNRKMEPEYHTFGQVAFKNILGKVMGYR